MKERGILFNGEMVRALLDGRKTQTRRIAKITDEWCNPGFVSPLAGHAPRRIQDHVSYCPFGSVGDVLWVREAHAIVPRTAYAHSDGVQQTLRPDDLHDAAIYRQGWERSFGGIRWRPSIHMPRWASRINLEVTEVRVERLNDISGEDAKAEGVLWDSGGWMDYQHHDGRRKSSSAQAYQSLWESINGAGSWDKNPWVWCILFRRI